jgi:outer membrane protein assembly factor BamB
MGEEVLTAPQTTLVILLGASQWPRWSDLGDSNAFANSARKVRTYFLDSQKFQLPQENLLDLFDSDASADTIDETISNFLATRMAVMAATNQAATDLVVYYIGHAGLVEESSEYYLAIRCTRKSHPGVSGLRIDALARTITKSARNLRRLIILDCCYAANAFNAFQTQRGGLEEVALVQAWDALKDPYPDPRAGTQYPRKGTALLCSSSRTKPSLLGPQGTEFTEALLYILNTGLANDQRKMSLRLVTNLLREFLDAVDSKAPRPEVHSPDQSEGNVAEVPFFPNFHFQEMQKRQVEGVEQGRWLKKEKRLRVQRQLHSPPVPQLPAASLQQPRRLNILVVLLCLVLLLSGGAATWLTLTKTVNSVAQKSTISKSVQFGFDAAHTHWNPDEHILNATNVIHIRQLWSFTLGGSADSSPAVAGGMVYIGASDGKVYAFDASCRSRCQPLWSFATGNAIDSSPAVAGGMVYIGSGDGSLYAFDASCRHHCQSLWSYQTGSAIDSSPTLANGIVYIGSSDDKLYAFDATCRSDCQPLWSFNTGKSVNSTPAVAGGMVYIFSQNGSLYAFDASCRHQCLPLWSFTVLVGGINGGFFDSSPAVAYGMVYIGSFDHTLYAFDASCRSGCQPLWSFTTGDAIVSSPTVANGVVYVNSWDGHLYTFNAACHRSCRPLNSFPLIAGSADSTPAVANGMIYMTSADLNFYALGLAVKH